MSHPDLGTPFDEQLPVVLLNVPQSVESAPLAKHNERIFKSTKTYGHERGLSCCFRQWRAGLPDYDSHCAQLHGYSLAFKFVFAARDLDSRNWVVDFGSHGPMREIKAFLDDTFDHTTLVAKDDPALDQFRALAEMGAAKLIVVDAVGCEQTAKLVYEQAQQILNKHKDTRGRVWLVSVEVSEHGSNSAIYG